MKHINTDTLLIGREKVSVFSLIDVTVSLVICFFFVVVFSFIFKLSNCQITLMACSDSSSLRHHFCMSEVQLFHTSLKTFSSPGSSRVKSQKRQRSAGFTYYSVPWGQVCLESPGNSGPRGHF